MVTDERPDCKGGFDGVDVEANGGWARMGIMVAWHQDNLEVGMLVSPIVEVNQGTVALAVARMEKITQHNQ